MKLKRIFIVIGNKPLILTVLLFTTIFGLRPDSVGSDSASYQFFFNSSIDLPFERGFNLIIVLLRPFGWAIFKLIVAFLYVSLTAYNLVKMGLSVKIIFILFLTALFTQFGINTIRASSSLILLLYLIRHNGFTLQAFFWTIVASFFHLSAIMVAILFFLFKMESRFAGALLALLGVCSILIFHNFQGIEFIILKYHVLNNEELHLLSEYADKTYRTGFRPEFLVLPWFYLALISKKVLVDHLFIGLALLPVMLFPMMDRVFIFYWVFSVLMFLKMSKYELRLKVIALLPLIPGLVL